MSVQVISSQDSLWRETLQKLRHDVYHFPEYLQLEAERNHTKSEAFLFTEDDKIFFVPYLLRSCNDILAETTRRKSLMLFLLTVILAFY